MALYDATTGDNWMTKTNWKSDTPLGMWHGVTTNPGGRVTSLSLGGALVSNRLDGQLPPELGNLSELTTLTIFGNNDLTGPIPATLGNLSNLTELVLGGNDLDGPIPPELGNLAALTSLSLSSNELTGPIPPELGNLPKLETLNLFGNNLSGPIPPELGNLGKTLTSIQLSRNSDLTGCVPYQLRSVATNDFTATGLPICGIPPGIAADRMALVALYDATTGDNWMTKTNWKSDMPLGMWHGVTTNSGGRVTALILGNILGSNRLNGQIPPELGNLSELTRLTLFGNTELTGPIPATLGNLSKLTRLNLGNNELTGPIPVSLNTLSDMTELILTRNNLSGPIPPELDNLPKLTSLWLNANMLAGPIPPELGNLPELTSLWLNDNMLAGPIPLELGDLGDTLTALALSGTDQSLTGCVPYPLRNVGTNDFGALGLPFCPPRATLVLSPASITENGGAAAVTATLDVAPAANVTLTVSVAPVAADYFALSANTILTIAMGKTTSTGDVTITAVDNDTPNPNRTVTVSAVLPDGFMLPGNLMVANPEDVTLTIRDDEGIEQRDAELVLAGAARSMASDAVDVLAGRFGASPTGVGSQMTLAGHALRLTPQNTQETDVWRRTAANDDAAWWDDRQHAATALSAQELLTRSSFLLALDGGEGASALTLWGRGSVSGFAGSPQAGFKMDGSYTSGWLGLDYRIRPSLLVGLAVSLGTGSVEHERTGGIKAESDMTLTSLAPYAHLQVGPGLELWGLLGFGQGEMESRVAGASSAAPARDIASFIGAGGGRQELTNWDGIDLAVRADAFVATLQSGGTANLPEASGEAQRVRLLVEGSADWSEDAGTRVVPWFTLGGRWDGGTANSGAGVEIGGGLVWKQIGAGLHVEFQGRYLLAHSADGLEDWGASLDLRFDPGADELGIMLGLSPTLGDAASGAERLYGDADLTDLAANDNRTGRLEAELAYGVAGFGGAGTVTPYGGLALDGRDTTRYRLGSRVALDSSLDLAVEGNRIEQDGASVSHGISTQLGLRW